MSFLNLSIMQSVHRIGQKRVRDREQGMDKVEKMKQGRYKMKKSYLLHLLVEVLLVRHIATFLDTLHPHKHRFLSYSVYRRPRFQNDCKDFLSRYSNTRYTLDLKQKFQNLIAIISLWSSAGDGCMKTAYSKQ